MTLRSIRNALLSLAFSLVVAQGIVLAQSMVTVKETLLVGAPEPQSLYNLSNFGTILAFFG